MSHLLLTLKPEFEPGSPDIASLIGSIASVRVVHGNSAYSLHVEVARSSEGELKQAVERYCYVEPYTPLKQYSRRG